VVLVVGAGAAAVPVTLFSPPSPLEHCIVVNKARWARVRPQHVAKICVSGVPRVAAHFFQIFYQFLRILPLFRGEFQKHWGCQLP